MSDWIIEQSHVVDHPGRLTELTIPELRRWVRARAAQPRTYSHQLPFGKIEFVQAEDGSLLWAYFRDKHGERKRFMRLRRL